MSTVDRDFMKCGTVVGNMTYKASLTLPSILWSLKGLKKKTTWASRLVRPCLPWQVSYCPGGGADLH